MLPQVQHHGVVAAETLQTERSSMQEEAEPDALQEDLEKLMEDEEAQSALELASDVGTDAAVEEFN